MITPERINQLVIELPYSAHDVETMLRIGFSPEQIRGAAKAGLLLTPIIQNIMTIAALDGTVDELLQDRVSYIKSVKLRTNSSRRWCYVKGDGVLGKLKWIVARYLDRNPDRCWSRLCDWAAFGKWRNWRDYADDIQCCEGPVYYCGKCERDE